MGKTEIVQARMEPTLKEEAEEILAQLGLSPTAAITMLYRQIVLQRSLPLDVALPNATTQQAMRDAEEGRNLIRAPDLGSLLAALDEDD